ncbi:BA75_01293T0 [Komagataella pastoris]|uniref:BA75_01293T0 n=1 Tax=Komagataella pastoris TaxID=4922 RepID=A0A1B2J5E8_PICPA|nr:BA75_01293T0 [Komagataella pastoris]
MISPKRLQLLIEELETLLNEETIIKGLNDDYDSTSFSMKVEPVLRKTYNMFNGISVDLSGKNKSQVQALYKSYTQLLKTLAEDLSIDTSSFKVENILSDSQNGQVNDNSQKQSKKSKSVRFKDNLIEPGVQEIAVAPYYDDAPDTKGSAINTLNNQSIFIDNQQELLRQDDVLDRLSHSVGKQREIGLTIGGEVDDQVVMLDDLEAQIDHNENTLNRARGRITKFSQMSSENGRLMSIFGLLILLILLIVLT